MKTIWKTIRVVVLAILCFVMIFVGAVTFLAVTAGIGLKILTSDIGSVYETNDLAEYGNIVGNYDNEQPKEFIFSFFPEAIDEQFADVCYHYKAIKGDTYAYEAWLEFTIPDKTQFASYVNEIKYRKEAAPYMRDEIYTEHIFSDELYLTQDDGKFWIQYAELGKILVSENTQKIIYVAIGVYDGGGVTTEQLSYYWDYFCIEPYCRQR